MVIDVRVEHLAPVPLAAEITGLVAGRSFRSNLAGRVLRLFALWAVHRDIHSVLLRLTYASV